MAEIEKIISIPHASIQKVCGIEVASIQKVCGWSTGVWYHVAMIRNGNNYMFFRSGIKLGNTSTDITAVSNFSNSNVYISYAPRTTYDHAFDGWIDELRISKGIARWTDNFTAPIIAYSYPDV